MLTKPDGHFQPTEKQTNKQKPKFEKMKSKLLDIVCLLSCRPHARKTKAI